MNRARATCALALSALILLTIAVQPVTANTRLDTLYAFLAGRYDAASEGGYSYTGSVASRAEPTYSAAYALDELGYLDSRPPFIDLLMMKNFTQKLQWESGGEEHARYGGFSSYIAGPVDIATSFTAIRLWQVVSQHNDIPQMNLVTINETALLVYVNKTHSSSGGFGLGVDALPDMLSTYRALFLFDYAWNALASSHPEENKSKWLPDPGNTTEWILSCLQDNAFRLSPDSHVPGVSATAAAIMALDILGELENLDALTSLTSLESISDWILARQVEAPLLGQFVGGFTEGVNTNDTNLVSTYYALKAIDALPTVSQVNSTVAVDFILDCQAEDGSWGFTPGLPVGSITNIQYAVESLKLLGQDPRTALLAEDPNSPRPILIDWRIVLVAGFIAIAVVLAVVSVRRS